MAIARARNPQSIARQMSELAVAAPLVISHRLSRMALPGTPVSARDRKEFIRMIVEKPFAAGEALLAINAQSLIASQAIAASLLRSWWAPWLGAPSHSLATLGRQNALRIVAGAIAPVHRTAVANSKRLGRGARRRKQR